jgi:hypothetical protein
MEAVVLFKRNLFNPSLVRMCFYVAVLLEKQKEGRKIQS